MRWFYQLEEKSKRFIIYRYSRENKALDGRIVFDVKNQTASIMKACAMDGNSKKAQAKAIEHFASIIEEGFPEEYYACCG